MTTVSELKENIEDFMRTKIYYYNCYLSRFIWITYATGLIVFIVSSWLLPPDEGDEAAANIVGLVKRTMYILLARLLSFLVKYNVDARGVSKN